MRAEGVDRPSRDGASLALSGVRCWVFDLDGTLTLPNHDFDAIRTELGIPAGELILEHLAGLPEHRARTLTARLDAIEAELAATVIGQRGCRELLESLAGSNRRLGILTRNTRANARTSLTRLGVDHLFHPADILGRHESPPKPDPGGILHLLRRWGASSEESAMVGDFHLDLDAGNNAGVRTVLLDPDGTSPWRDRAHLCIRDLAELAAMADPV